jgi:hypothetical protein
MGNDAMSHSDWRSPASYDRTEALDQTGFAWECVRRSPNYHRDFQVAAGTSSDPILSTTFRDRWGLSFRS